MHDMGTQTEAFGYRLRETGNSKCIPPSIKPSYKTKSQPVEGRSNEKQVEKHPCYGCGLLGHRKLNLIKASTLTLQTAVQQRINYWWLS